MRTFGNGKITEMAENFNENKPMNESNKRITKLGSFVNQKGHYSDISKEAEDATEEFIKCFNTAEGLSKVADLCDKRRKEMKNESKVRMDEMYHRNKGSLDDFLDY